MTMFEATKAAWGAVEGWNGDVGRGLLWQVGFWLCGGFALVAVVLHMVGQGLVRVIQPLGVGARFALRHAVLNLADTLAVAFEFY